jgi:hypothetical protein
MKYMKIIKKGKTEKIDGCYRVTEAVVDCEGKPLDLEEFLRAHDVPPKAPVLIEKIKGTDPFFEAQNIHLAGR